MIDNQIPITKLITHPPPLNLRGGQGALWFGIWGIDV